MKKILLFQFLIAGSLSAQTHQKEILSYVDSCMGKKVGKGYCYELVQGAFRQYIADYNMRSIPKDEDRYGKKIRFNELAPGDIVLEKGGLNHVCIVYKVDGEKIYVAEQNFGDKLSESVVAVNALRIDWLKEYYNADLYFFRPE